MFCKYNVLPNNALANTNIVFLINIVIHRDHAAMKHLQKKSEVINISNDCDTKLKAICGL